MIIEIMSKDRILEYSYVQHDEKAAVISISDYDEEFPNLRNNPNNGIAAQCRVSFDDVELGEIYCITDGDADKIVSFVNEIAVKKDKLIVQCGYGISRSAGVGAAILKHYADKDMLIWSNPRYRPNITCYRSVMIAFGEIVDEQKLLEKITVNRNLGNETDGISKSTRLILLNDDGEEMRI